MLETAQLQAVPAECWPGACLVPVPCLRLCSLRYPVHEYYAAVRRKQDPPPPGPADTRLAITRWDYVVRHYPLSRPEYEVLHALMAGLPVGDAISLAAQTAGTDLDRLAANLRTWFESWAANGFFRAVELRTEVGPAGETEGRSDE